MYLICTWGAETAGTTQTAQNDQSYQPDLTSQTGQTAQTTQITQITRSALTDLSDQEPGTLVFGSADRSLPELAGRQGRATWAHRSKRSSLQPFTSLNHGEILTKSQLTAKNNYYFFKCKFLHDEKKIDRIFLNLKSMISGVQRIQPELLIIVSGKVGRV